MLDFCRDASGNLVRLIWRFLDPDCKCHLESLVWKVFIYQNSFSYSHTLVTCNLCYNVYEFVIYVPALDTSCIFVLLKKFSFEKKNGFATKNMWKSLKLNRILGWVTSPFSVTLAHFIHVYVHSTNVICKATVPIIRLVLLSFISTLPCSPLYPSRLKAYKLLF